jgi:hypothetical protein
VAYLTFVEGAYHNKTDELGKVLSDHYLFGSVVATILVVVVTAQVKSSLGVASPSRGQPR